ncbi:rho GTPase-activating protein 28 [Cololabis saira]|uniref:rho GTPase-activating protein 28 n=1 Tax=Cololabis saira TaxID=129043 RepID=UPI002AD53163|nr:rho GTPase-activating protein 28 [Cololabis saira]XP_061569730.1 rho GTPase-activating protein 28 [Cololabis saira]
MLSSPSTTSTLPSSLNPNPRRVAMETYWREVQSIEEEKDGDEEEEEEEERKSMDEVELEESWLMEAGLSSLVTGSPTSEAIRPPAEAVLSTLTRQQAATVRKRLDNYNETLRKRNRQPIRDVRDIFSEPDDDSAEQCPSPLPSRAESPPSRSQSPIKTIRRHSTRVRPTLAMFVLEDHLPEQLSPPANTDLGTVPPSACPSHSPPVSQLKPASWLLRGTPYSEGVAEHRRGGACWDCLLLQGDKNGELQFAAVPPSQGLTCADDLCSRDLRRLGFITHIELSTFLLALGVQSKRTRPLWKRTRDSGVFGVPLTSLLENDRKKIPGLKVPVVFQKLLCILEQTGLHTEGILRVPGSAARLKQLRRDLDRCSAAFDWSTIRQVDAAGLLKLFVRELPIPLLTHTHLSTYRAVLGVSSEVHQIQALQLLSLLLPEAHRQVLKALLVFLRKVVFHQEQNRMSLWNVSMVMAPNLFAPNFHGNKSSIAKQQEEMEEAVGGAKLIQLMIRHQDLLWTIPNFLLSQVRQMNQASNQRNLIRTKSHLLKGRTHKNNRSQITELWDGIIRVHAPLHAKVSMAIQLDEQTAVRDITSRFESDGSPAQRLYEVGGNICERRLHPDCRLLDVYRANPRCDWLIKP